MVARVALAGKQTDPYSWKQNVSKMSTWSFMLLSYLFSGDKYSVLDKQKQTNKKMVLQAGILEWVVIPISSESS